MNNLKSMISEKESLLTKLDTLMNEFESINKTISTLEQALDDFVFAGSDTDATLTALAASTLRYQSLSRVINDIETNMIPAADQRVEIEEEAAREDIRAARQTLYDKCAGDIQKKMNDILKIIQIFDIECQKIADDAGLSAGLNQPIFYIPENDRIQFSD